MCIVLGCRAKGAEMICPRHWWLLTTKLRRRWQRETKDNSDKPSAELVAEINRVIAAREARNKK
jgi:hypothetical protein